MKKVFLTLSAIILTISNLVANPVDVDMARKTARGFVNTAFAETSRDNAMDLVLTTDDCTPLLPQILELIEKLKK